MRFVKKTSIHAIATFLLAFAPAIHAQRIDTGVRAVEGRTVLSMSNDRVECAIVIEKEKLVSDKIAARAAWAQQYGSGPAAVETDADFSCDIMWTDWLPPKGEHNAQNPVTLQKADFILREHSFQPDTDGSMEIWLNFACLYKPLALRVVYRLSPDAWYFRRSVTLFDTTSSGHFLQHIAAREGIMLGRNKVIKAGGFGQPIAVQSLDGSAFIALEYPAGENSISGNSPRQRIVCRQEIGEHIGPNGVGSAWVVTAAIPDYAVKRWFMDYVSDIRVAEPRPYTLYNSWYDLRSSEYPGVPAQNKMNEENVLRIATRLREKMVEAHGIPLDAFVLDDGWDTYESDWLLRAKEFPRGLDMLAKELDKSNTALGLWFGPSGGYSFRRKRIDWLHGRGYEVTGKNGSSAMMCIAGKKYAELLSKRMHEFMDADAARYFKLDGFQFSCSEADHGHPVGIFSRRAAVKSLMSLASNARLQRPDVYLNITSGTWLSPWWLQHANQIWMQGEDVGFSDVPSLNPRDASITYRDVVLYEGLRNHDSWFPMENLMTHGIVKGALEQAGGENETLESFANEVMMYLARGVSMWELYISPDQLTDGEWDVLSRSLRWARDRFPVLTPTELIGGDPNRREAYGYMHMKGSRGVIAARNPWIDNTALKVQLTHAYGVDVNAQELVVEKVYPERWIAPRLFKAGETMSIPLGGYETAVFEVYPAREARRPLVAGIPFSLTKSEGTEYTISLHGMARELVVLNPGLVKSLNLSGQEVDLLDVLRRTESARAPVPKNSISFKRDSSSAGADVAFTIDKSVQQATVAVLLTPTKNGETDTVRVFFTRDGISTPLTRVPGEGVSSWHILPVERGLVSGQLRFETIGGDSSWTGRATLWCLCLQKPPSLELQVKTREAVEEAPLPPTPLKDGVLHENVRIGEMDLRLGNN